MAVPAETFKTYEQIGLREDLTNRIWDISPMDTPFISAIGRTPARAVTHEWQTDTLAAAAADAAQEGDDAPGNTASPTTRVRNVCQIFTKDARVSGTGEEVSKAGRRSEMAYQVEKRVKELKRNMEFTFLANQGVNAGDATTARTARGLPSWLTSNTSFDTSSTVGANATTDVNGRTDGDQRLFIESYLDDVMESAANAGGEPRILLTPSNSKRRVSKDFVGRSNSREQVTVGTINSKVSVYMSDFGDLAVVFDRFMRDRDVFCVDPAMAATAFLRPFRTWDLAKTGDSERKQVLAEATLEVRNEAAHAGIFDLNSSYSTA